MNYKYKGISWIHRIELSSGKVTPGKWPPNFEEYGLYDINFKNKRVLDIGCLNGVYSFFAEKQGAKKVLSIDILENKEKGHPQGSQTTEGYLYAHRSLRSKSKYIFPLSLYDLNKRKFGEFDVVLMLGVIYHLAHPILSLEKINKIMRGGAY